MIGQYTVDGSCQFRERTTGILFMDTPFSIGDDDASGFCVILVSMVVIATGSSICKQAGQKQTCINLLVGHDGI